MTLILGCAHQQHEPFPFKPPQPIKAPKNRPISYVDPKVQSDTRPLNASTCARISGTEILECGPDPSDPEFIKERNPAVNVVQGVGGEGAQPQSVKQLSPQTENFFCSLLREIREVPSIGGFNLMNSFDNNEAQILLSTKSTIFLYPSATDASNTTATIDCDGFAPLRELTVVPNITPFDLAPRYCFLYRVSSFCPSRFFEFQNKEKNILIVTTRYDIQELFEMLEIGNEISTLREFNEIVRTIVHESFHLYAQASVSQPRAGVGFARVAQLESRRAIDSMYRSEKRYNDSVRAEFCSMASSLNFDSRDPNLWRTIIKNVLNHMRIRDQTFKSGSAERFWYYFEGVPMYLDQRLSLDNNRSFLGMIKLVCEGQAHIFFPLYSGAVLAFALDNLEGERLCAGWREKANLGNTGVAKWFKFLERCVKI